MTLCENCGQEIDEDEVQECDLCGMDGLGDCCIGSYDHDCEEQERRDAGEDE